MIVELAMRGFGQIADRTFRWSGDDIGVVRLGEPDVKVMDTRTIVDGVSFNFAACHQAWNAATALAALDALGLPRPRGVAEGRRRIAVLGDMAERGRAGPGYHREIAEAAAELGVDELLAVGELARDYVDGGVPGRWVPDVHEALRALDAVIRPGYAVLMKASRAVGLEAVADALAGVGST